MQPLGTQTVFWGRSLGLDLWAEIFSGLIRILGLAPVVTVILDYCSCFLTTQHILDPGAVGVQHDTRNVLKELTGDEASSEPNNLAR